MKNSKIDLNWVIIILCCVILSVLTILFSYHTTLFFFPQTIAQENTIGYLNDNTVTLLQNYTPLELSHLEDVQKVMSTADKIFYVSLVLSFILLIYGFKRKLLPKMLLYGGISIVSIIGLILLFSVISFNSSFTAFHEIFFPQGNWQFPSDSLLIQTFPLDFFIKIAFIIFIQTLCWGSLFIVVGYHLQKRDRCKN
jgi:integral membrane protein (TIGR01906 family)